MKGLDINIQDIINNPEKGITLPINIKGAMLDKLNNFAEASKLAGLKIKFEYIDKMMDSKNDSSDSVDTFA